MLLDAELIFYAATFGIGLLVAVYAMLHGTVRTGRTPGMIEPPHAAFNAPVVAAALIAFGAVCYPVAKYSHLASIATLVLALIAAALAWVGMGILMAKWALSGPLSDPHEDIEELQGTIATVTRAIARPVQPCSPPVPARTCAAVTGWEAECRRSALSGAP